MKSDRIFLAVLFLIVLYWMGKLYSQFLLDITIACLLAIAMYNINIFFLKYLKRTVPAAICTSLLLCMFFIIPLVYIISFASKLPAYFESNMLIYWQSKAISIVQNFQSSIPESLEFLNQQIDDFIKQINLVEIGNKVVLHAATIGKMGAVFLTHSVLIIIFFFFALLYGKDIANYIKSVLPMEDIDIESLFEEVANVMGVVFYSIILNAILQGSLFSIIVMSFGYDGLLFGVLFAFASLVPIIGGALMWAPIAINEYLNGNLASAIIIATYSVIVISIIADTFIKPMLIKYINQKLVSKPAHINELLIFFSIIAGLSSFGFWGMILGPAITTFFLSLLKLYKSIKKKQKLLEQK